MRSWLIDVGLILPVLLWVGNIACSDAFATDINASWDYQVSGKEGGETTDRLLQRYNLSTGFTLEPTDAITTGTSITYSRYHTTGLGTNETITPSATFELNNDLFIAALDGTYSQSRNANSETLDSYNWEASLSSGRSWQPPYWPNLRIYFGESGQNSDDEQIDSSETSYGSDINYDWSDVLIYYGFNERHAEDHVNRNEVDSTTHSVHLESVRNFWNNRLTTKLIENINYTSTDFKIAPGGGLDSPITFARTFMAVTSQSQVDFISLVPFVPPVVVELDEAGQLGVDELFDTDGLQLLNQLNVFVDEITAINVESGDFDLQWALYVSTDNLNWELLPGQGNVDVPFDSIDRVFKVSIPSLAGFPNANYLKAVAINHDTKPVTCIGLLPIQVLTESESQTSTTYQTNLSISYKISPTLIASSSLLLLIGDEFTNRDIHSNLNWSPSPYAGLSLGFSESRREPNEQEDQIDRTYSITVPTNPLPTLNVTFGALRAESFTGSHQTEKRHNFSINSSAIVYPDLTTTLSLVYSKGETEDISGEKSDVEGFSANMTLNARLTRRLQATFSHFYQQSVLPNDSTTQYSSLNVAYRPSEILVMRLLVDKPWTGNDPETIDFKADLALVRSHKTRVNFIYRHLHSETDTDAVGLLGSWDISDIFALQSQLRYYFAETDSWNASIKLIMNL